MNLTTVTTILGSVAAALFAWNVGGSVGTGVLAGFLSGAAVSGLCILRLRLASKKDPGTIVRVTLEGFLIKLAFLMIGGLSFGLIEPLGEMVDVRGFLIAFVTGAVLVLVPGTLETVRGLSVRRPTAVSQPAKT